VKRVHKLELGTIRQTLIKRSFVIFMGMIKNGEEFPADLPYLPTYYEILYAAFSVYRQCESGKLVQEFLPIMP